MGVPFAGNSMTVFSRKFLTTLLSCQKSKSIYLLLKFRYSPGKATKIEKNSPFFRHSGRFSQNFIAFSGYLNFNDSFVHQKWPPDCPEKKI